MTDADGDGQHLTGLFDDADSLEEAIAHLVELAVQGAHPPTLVLEFSGWIGAQHPTDAQLEQAIGDPNRYVARGGTLGLEDYETLTVWQRRAVRAVLDGQQPRS